MNEPVFIYKITPRAAWEEAKKIGVFYGAPIDLTDGFIHFSTASQVVETAKKHFSKMDDLLLIAVKADALGDLLKWEISRGGDLFPHLYGELAINKTHWEEPMLLGDNGLHIFPEQIA